MAGGGALLAANVIPVVAVVNIGTVAVLNSRNKRRVVAEFQRRRLPVPWQVGPGDVAHGSWFFPMTPSPRELIVRGRHGAEEIELRVPLPGLAQLHLKPAPSPQGRDD